MSNTRRPSWRTVSLRYTYAYKMGANPPRCCHVRTTTAPHRTAPQKLDRKIWILYTFRVGSPDFSILAPCRRKTPRNAHRQSAHLRSNMYREQSTYPPSHPCMQTIHEEVKNGPQLRE